MTVEEFIKRLEIVAEMGDKQIETLANLLIDFFAGKDKKRDFGFTAKKEKE